MFQHDARYVYIVDEERRRRLRPMPLDPERRFVRRPRRRERD